MATYTITTANWNDPSFWNSIVQASGGHTLDFSGLTSNFIVTFDADSNELTITDGTTTLTIGEPGTSTVDANLGGPSGSTQWSFFDEIIGSDGGDVLSGDGASDTISGQGGNDTIEGDGGDDTLRGGDGDDTLYGDTAGGTVRTVLGDDFSSGWTTSGGVILDSTRALFLNDNATESFSTTTPTGMGSGPGAGGGAQVTFDVAWSDGDPAADSGAGTTLSVIHDGVTYATITTPAGDGTTAIVEFVNGASGSPATLAEGNAIEPSGYTTITIDLPAGIADSGTLTFSSTAVGTDDFSIDNVAVVHDIEASGSGNDTLIGGTGDDTIDGGQATTRSLGMPRQPFLAIPARVSCLPMMRSRAPVKRC